jgi:hypothetical protein
MAKTKKTPAAKMRKIPNSDTDAAFFSDAIVYHVEEKKFYSYPLLSDGRDRGFLDLIGEDRINLTERKRLKGLLVPFSTNTSPKKVYFFATVAFGKYSFFNELDTKKRPFHFGQFTH